MKTLPLAATLLLLTGTLAHADQLIGSYTAFIGEDDLYNSRGERLKAPWEVLRQDRANVHKFGISQEGDEDDDFFGSIENRAALEYMVEQGRISGAAARAIVNGNVYVKVDIYGNNGRGTFVKVAVSRD